MKDLVFKAKITPKKVGQFVSIWKRNSQGITVPHDIKDKFDYMIIELENSLGKFSFPKNVLLENKIISGRCSDGKNGFRVYAPTDKVINKQAISTKNWQIKYFSL